MKVVLLVGLNKKRGKEKRVAELEEAKAENKDRIEPKDYYVVLKSKSGNTARDRAIERDQKRIAREQK